MAHTSGPRRLRVALSAGLTAALLAMVPPIPAGAAAAPPRDVTRFGCPASAPNPFSDIAGSVHAEAIRCGAAHGFINGTTSTTFSPHASVTRGQLASFLARLVAFSGFPLDTTDQGFTDIAGNVHRDAINALAAFGAINGTTPTTFAPNRPVTREQAASMVARLGPDGGPPAPDAFTDDDGSVHEPNINALAESGIVGGVTPTRFQPKANITRAATASILARAQDFAVEFQLSIPLGPTRVVRAALRGQNEVPGPGDNAAQGAAQLVRSSVEGLLCFVYDIDLGLSAAPVAAHVHRGAAGVAGPVVITLPTPVTEPNGQGFHTGCAPDLDPAIIDEIFADPSDFYVNVHTGAFPDGAIRGQLARIATPLGTLLSGAEEVPGPGETGAGGDVAIDVMSDGTTICSFLFYDGDGTPTAAHIHDGAAGVEGVIVVTLPPFDPDGPFSDGCVGGLDPMVVTDIAANPDDYYVNVHTGAFPNGAVRGQLDLSGLLDANLTGAAEAPGPGDPDGAGGARVDLIGDGLICARVEVRGIATPVAAHIHQGAVGVAGPVVVTLPTPTFNAANDCLMIDEALFDAIVANPAGYYVNVHTGDFPDGAVRGQLAGSVL